MAPTKDQVIDLLSKARNMLNNLKDEYSGDNEELIEAAVDDIDEVIESIGELEKEDE